MWRRGRDWLNNRMRWRRHLRVMCKDQTYMLLDDRNLLRI
jgi:hypothetical protein